jgi:hypothetical protein
VSSGPRPAIERLAEQLTGKELADPMTGGIHAWLASSARFRTFAEANRDKIRKKFRGATDPEASLDVRAELRTARLLLADRRIELAFEAYGAGKRGPDFTISFRGAPGFNLEVTRLRRVPPPGALAASLLAKLRQLPPSTPNAVLFAAAGIDVDLVDVDAAVRALRLRADAKDEEFFSTRGFAGTRAFYERYLRLGAVFITAEGAVRESRATLWLNRSARIALPEPAARACLRSLGEDV